MHTYYCMQRFVHAHLLCWGLHMHTFAEVCKNTPMLKFAHAHLVWWDLHMHTYYAKVWTCPLIMLRFAHAHLLCWDLHMHTYDAEISIYTLIMLRFEHAHLLCWGVHLRNSQYLHNSSNKDTFLVFFCSFYIWLIKNLVTHDFRKIIWHMKNFLRNITVKQNRKFC